jgi:hypothetical protein
MSRAYSTSNVSRVITVLERFVHVEDLANRILKRLCDIGAEAVRNAYHGRWTGESGASVKVIQEGRKWSIVAESKGLLYLEFGAGVRKNPGGAQSAREIADELVISGNYDGIDDIGTRGHGHGSDKSGWWYPNETGEWVHTKGTQAAHGFANALTAINAEKYRVIREELAKWK